jgi:HlyD family secretion protein
MPRNTTLFAAPALAAAALVALAGCGGKKLPDPSGSFEATVVDVAPVIAGRVLAVRGAEGQRVARGDTLVILDTELIALQRVETAARRESLLAERRAATADLEQVRRQRELTATTLARAAALLEQGSATGQRVDDLAAQRDMADDRIEAARARIAALDAESARLDAGLAVLDRQLREGVLLSPLDGTVLTRSLEPGEVAAAGRTALRLADLTRLELRVFLESGDLDRVRLGQDLPVAVDALPGVAFTGRVAWISEEAEFTPKNAQTRHARAQLVHAVKLDVANPDGRLHVGMPAEVRLP